MIDGTVDAAPLSEGPYFDQQTSGITQRRPRSVFLAWLLRESPHIAMLSLALIGVSFPVPMTYWLAMTPVFAIISIVSGWRHFPTRQGQIRMVCLQTVSWGALVLAIYALYNDGADGVLNANAISLAMITVLALGTFLAGLHAHSWRTSAVGMILFVAVPVLGWIDQSSILLLLGAFVFLGIAGMTWFVIERQPSTN
jgi:hypothetical protein